MTLKTAHVDLLLLAAPVTLSGLHLYLLLVSNQPGWVYLSAAATVVAWSLAYLFRYQMTHHGAAHQRLSRNAFRCGALPSGAAELCVGPHV